MSEWFDRLSSLLMGEPKDQKQLIEILRDAESRHLLKSDVLTMIEGVLHVSKLMVRDIMVPRQHMVMLDDEESLAQVLRKVVESGHSRFPVINHAQNDEVLGLVHSKDLLAMLSEGKEKSEGFVIKKMLRDIMIVPETKPLDVLLKEFRTKHKHMALAVDEYGHVVGLVTIEDVLEQIVGDIEDEHDSDANEMDENIIRQTESLYIINAHTPLDEFNAYFHTQLSHDEFNTIGGIVLHQFGRVPMRGEEIQVHHLQFKVLNCDKRRIHQLELTLPAGSVLSS